MGHLLFKKYFATEIMGSRIRKEVQEENSSRKLESITEKKNSMNWEQVEGM